MNKIDEHYLPIKALPDGSRVRRGVVAGLAVKALGGASPRLGDGFDELDRARNSFIYWWYRCLQVHEQYQYCCGSGGEGPLAELYKDFGNVLDLPFNTWWHRHGRKAFQETQPFKKVSLVTSNFQVDFKNQDNNLLVVAIPLSKRKVTAMREVGKLLAAAHEKAHNGQKVDIWKLSTAKRQIIKNKVRLSTVAQLLKLRMVQLENPQAKLYEIGPLAGVEPDLQARFTHNELITNEYERRRMTIAVSRLLAKAKHLIDNAALGIFPSFNPPDQSD